MAKRTPNQKNMLREFAGLPALATTHGRGCKCGEHKPKTVITASPMSLRKLRPHDPQREVILFGGPLDGQTVKTGTMTALRLDGHLYCHIEFNEDSPDVFRHPATWLLETAQERVKGDLQEKAEDPGLFKHAVTTMLQRERAKIEEWCKLSDEAMLAQKPPLPMAYCMPIPPNRIGAHWVCVKHGEPLLLP